MKKQCLRLSVLSLVLLFISITVSAGNWIDKKVSGNGNVIEKQREVVDFNAIAAAEGLNVFLKQGKENKVTVVADENLHEYILTEVNGGTLKIHLENNIQIKKSKSKDIYVTLVSINSLKASSGAEIVSEPLNLKELEAYSSSGADMNIEVKAERIYCKASSGSDFVFKGKSKEMKLSSSSGADMKVMIYTENLSGEASSGADIDISGEASSLKVSTSSAGDFNAFGLQTKICSADASSGSDINVSVSKDLVANASSGGSIRYKGDPRVDIHKSSGGSVKQD